MKKLTALCTVFLAVSTIIGCKNKAQKNDETTEPIEDNYSADSTVYGVCGEGTAMHTLELITNQGDTVIYGINLDEPADTEPYGATGVKGGLLVGDRLAVIAGPVIEGDKTAKTVINLTTLLGKWTSINRNFEIQDGGVVKSNVNVEDNPWTSWKIYNGNLLLNKDTFKIDELGADSLYLENNKGIFVYKRQQ